MSERTLDELLNLDIKKGKIPHSRLLQAKPHSPPYMMHKFWARRPYNVFAELISRYTKPNDIILDPFCGGGVTVIEALRLKRKVVGVDVNPLATYITEMEVKPVNYRDFLEGFKRIESTIGKEIQALYKTSCPKCGSKEAIFDWLEWDEERKTPLHMKYDCSNCGKGEKQANDEDRSHSRKIDDDFEKIAHRRGLWYPEAMIPKGDKTEGLIKKGYTHFFQLFTKRNLLSLALANKEIRQLDVKKDVQDFLLFAFSSSLKWASKQSHLRGEIVEGWAMHAYWLYPKTLEINVWNTLSRRCMAIARGKEYTNQNIGGFFRKAKTFEDIFAGDATCLILNQSSKRLPIPEETVDAIITDPPFGGNVNYGELADYWIVWKNRDTIVDKKDEVIINRNQRKTLNDYEEGLKQVFDQCFRVLKKDGNMVVTFNSKNLRVVASFVIATARAGFSLHPQGLVYQPPIRAYTTTFHALQVGSFTGDFIFTFCKPRQYVEDNGQQIGIGGFKDQIDSLIDNHVAEKITESELREKAYRTLIPFLAIYSGKNLTACRESVDYFESQMRKLGPHFRELRESIVKQRKRRFLTRKAISNKL